MQTNLQRQKRDSCLPEEGYEERMDYKEIFRGMEMFVILTVVTVSTGVCVCTCVCVCVRERNS